MHMVVRAPQCLSATHTRATYSLNTLNPHVEPYPQQTPHPPSPPLPYEAIPGPPPLPIIGNLLDIIRAMPQVCEASCLRMRI